jgi:ribonucleotide monophosphatase NagD (HAD superfamily)
VLAKHYEQLGGAVTSFGKPYADVYDVCMKKHSAPKARVLAIGDSLETDIPGGQNYGIDTLLITGGILKHLTPVQITEECNQLGLQPTYIAGGLR